MDLVLRFSFAAQVIAALVIFMLGYVGLFATLMLAMVIVRCLYEAGLWLNERVTASPPVAVCFPQSARDQSETSIPISSTHFINATPCAEIAFHATLNRRRAPQVTR